MIALSQPDCERCRQQFVPILRFTSRCSNRVVRIAPAASNDHAQNASAADSVGARAGRLLLDRPRDARARDPVLRPAAVGEVPRQDSGG